jgi:group I intron endonuclease
MVNPYRFYTYAYLREDGTPYYIGKGKGNRAYRRRNKGIKPPKDKTRIIFLKQNLIEEEAFKHEIYMISVFGRKDLGTGILHNRTGGGDGCSGAIRSEETKQKMSEALKGRIFTEEHKKNIGKSSKGRIFTEETRKKMSNSHLGKLVGEKHSWYGKKHTEETKKQLSELNRGSNNYFYGKTHTKEAKQKMSSFHNKLLRLLSPSGEIVEEITTIRKFCEKYNLDRKEISKVIKGELHQFKGWSVPI